ncbi:MAG: L-serine ammonia-lyase, iron-sulfur-dependent, subunit alpha, partial [Vampirovibrionia bacterium]
MKNIDNFKELLTLSEDKTIVEVFEQLESFMTEKDISEIRNNMKKHLDEMKESIVKGLNDSTKSQSGMSGDDSEKVFNRLKQNKNILLNSLLSKILSYAIAVMEENQRMGIIVACPTAGACGI